MRHKNWQDRFWDILNEVGPQPFEFGKRDCVLFAATVADAISIDGRYAARAQEAFTWSSAREAAELLRRPLKDLVEVVLGPMTRWQDLAAGDIVCVLHDNGRGPEQTLGMHDGVQIMAPGDGKLIPLWWSEALGGWRVP